MASDEMLPADLPVIEWPKPEGQEHLVAPKELALAVKEEGLKDDAFRAKVIADYKRLHALAVQLYQRKLERVSPNFLVTQIAILETKIRDLENFKAGMPQRGGTQVNIQINGADLGRDGLVRTLVGQSMSDVQPLGQESNPPSTRQSRGEIVDAELDPVPTDNKSRVLPGNAGNDTPKDTKGQRRPKAKRRLRNASDRGEGGV